jgi:hypothetical protein
MTTDEIKAATTESLWKSLKLRLLGRGLYMTRIAEELEKRLDEACGTLADIGNSTDLTLEGCLNKARKRYAAIRKAEEMGR